MKSKNDAIAKTSSRSDEAHDEAPDEMLPEYDFSGGVRGKHAARLAEGYAVIVHHADGTTTETAHTSVSSGARSLSSQNRWQKLPPLDVIDVGSLPPSTPESAAS